MRENGICFWKLLEMREKKNVAGIRECNTNSHGKSKCWLAREYLFPRENIISSSSFIFSCSCVVYMLRSSDDYSGLHMGKITLFRIQKRCLKQCKLQSWWVCVREEKWILRSTCCWVWSSIALQNAIYSWMIRREKIMWCSSRQAEGILPADEMQFIGSNSSEILACSYFKPCFKRYE